MNTTKNGRSVAATSFLIAIIFSAVAQAQTVAPTCADLNWSVQVLALNPDIAESCSGVYARAGKLYAKAQIEIVRVRGNSLTFRSVHVDGSSGKAQRVTVPTSWRAEIEGRKYRASELNSGQRLNVYIPEDRFALAVHDGDFSGDEEMISIEEAALVTMPQTASPLFSNLAAGLALLGLGLGLTLRRHLRA
ncbi:MAG: hypothetical protein ACI87W_000303 [Halieaceae bacterium]|jgi:hypothetical protein